MIKIFFYIYKNPFIDNGGESRPLDTYENGRMAKPLVSYLFADPKKEKG